MMVRFILSISIFPLVALGQVKKDLNRYLRILPLGGIYSPEQKLEKGIIQHQPPKLGESAPAMVIVKDELPQEQVTAEGVQITAGRLSRFAIFGPNVKEICLSDQKPPSEAWCKFPAPEMRNSLAVLYCNHQKDDWRFMESLVLNEDASSFPLGAARFVNVSDRTLKLHFTYRKNGASVETQQGKVKPGQTYVRALSESGERVKITVLSESEDLFLREQMLKPGKDERRQFFFYKNKVKQALRPVRVVTFPEKIPKPPAPRAPVKRGE